MSKNGPGVRSSTWLLSSLIFATASIATISCAIDEDPADAAAAKPAVTSSGPRGYFLAVDGLQPRLLESFVKSKAASHGGFRKLWNEGLVFPAARAKEISITAASFTSIATCAPPSVHGITGNHFLRNHKRVSGFKEPAKAETMWQAARRQGKTVASFAYVGVDGTSPERSADYGITYPDEGRMGKPVVVSLKDSQGKPVDTEVALDPARDVRMTLRFIQEGAKSKARTKFVVEYTEPSGKKMSVNLPTLNSTQPPANILVHDGERLRRIMIRAVSEADQTWLVSRASYNAAHPESLRKSLDESGKVWPDVNLKGLTLAFKPEESVIAQATLDDFIAEVAVATIKSVNPDIVLLYQPLIDSTGHGYQNALPNAASLNGGDPVSRAFMKAFQHVDRNLAKVLATARNRDYVAVTGDHGMAATTDNFNIAPLLPAGIDKVVDVYASDAMLYLYPVGDQPDPVAIKSAGLAVRDALATVARNGKPVIEMVTEKGAENTAAWQYGDAAWAFRAAEGLWFTNNPLDSATFLPPKVAGIHGHNPDFTSMHTTLIFSGPGIKGGIRRDTPASLIDAVPTFASLLKMTPPANCEGRQLL